MELNLTFPIAREAGICNEKDDDQKMFTTPNPGRRNRGRGCARYLDHVKEDMTAAEYRKRRRH